ncbi:MAG: type II toxin-antitoxin system RelE/ParE family toxin [Methylobacterium sp.]|nr:type II toxin-antitoxin system RelE/ParE family toxin [Methylobacterium sp.]
MKVVWTVRAVEDLIEIADYVSEHHPDAAMALRDRLRSAIEGLADFPMAGRPGRVAETRELIVPGSNYLVPYRVHQGRVEILAILHAARDWPQSF